jgi:tetratricopeptide (TPR) repeat protein
MAYTDRQMYPEALKTYQRAIAIQPDGPVPYHNLGNLYRAMGEKNLAVREWQTAIRLDPTFFFSYNALANFYAQEGHIPEAQKILAERDKNLKHSGAGL